jgi:hypothetical protein
LTTPRDSPPPCATRRATRHRGGTAESPRDQLACAAAAASRSLTGLRPEARYCAKHFPAGPASRARLTRSDAGPGRAAARRPRRGNARRVARCVTSPPTTGSHDSAARDRLRARAAPRGLRASPVRHRLVTATRCHAEIELDRPQQLDEIVAAPPRGSNPRRPSRQPHGASNPRGDTSRDTSLSSSLSPADPTSTRSNSSTRLTEPTARPTPLNRTRERRAPRLRCGASRSPTRLLQSPPGGWSTFQPAQAGPPLNRP